MNVNRWRVGRTCQPQRLKGVVLEQKLGRKGPHEDVVVVIELYTT